VPVIRQLPERLAMHRLRCGNPQFGPVFTNTIGKPLNMHNLLGRVIPPTLKAVGIPWHGWHAARRGLATNLDRLGIIDTLVQRILRHSSVATTRGHYIKPVEQDVRDAMGKLENSLLDINWTPTFTAAKPN
jgi:integrase